MKCEICHQNEAVISVENIQRNKTTKMFICPACAVSMMGLQMGGNPLLGFLQGLRQLAQSSTPGLTALQVDKKDFICPSCRTNYEEVEKNGAVGCPNCYASFKDFLDPLIYTNGFRVPYKGKFPKQMQKIINQRKKISALQSELKDLVEFEDFEKAAIVRDEIKREKKKLKKSAD